MIILYDNLSGQWLRFEQPVLVRAAYSTADVLPALEEITQAVEQNHLWAAGFMSYEASPAFDPAMVTRPAGSLPLVWFGLFNKPALTGTELPAKGYRSGAPVYTSAVSEIDFNHAIKRIKAHIAAGDTYQVNYTLRMRAAFFGDPLGYFYRLAAAQQAGYAAYVHTGQHALCSASPELFFELNGESLRSKPMKGTAARGRTLAEDRAQMSWLHHSEKNRAENVMIVDMVRNDMGRIAKIGSVHVPRLFEVERYPTLLQMTSTVACRTAASIPEIFKALFPCASITGAPKIRTMEIIRELEPEPRGIYTGTIGYLAPGRRAQFNVAIRTAAIDCRQGVAEYGTGSGVTWESDAGGEYAESLLKTQVLTVKYPSFRLLESWLWTPADGHYLLEHHLARLRASAEYFGFSFDEQAIRDKIAEASTQRRQDACKVRLTMGRKGDLEIEFTGLGEKFAFEKKAGRAAKTPLKGCLARRAVESSDVFLYHKTTNRRVYEKAAVPGFDQVLLYNEREEVTEFLTSNAVVEIGGKRFTPPAACGLLAGTFRAELLAHGEITERTIRLAELSSAGRIWAVNSVRGWQEVALTQVRAETASPPLHLASGSQ